MAISQKLYCCKIDDNSEVPSITTEFLTALDYDHSSWTDKERDFAFHIVYTDSPDKADSVKNKIISLKESWREFGITLGEIETMTIKKEEWSEVWKKHFKIIHISDTLVVKPSFLEYDATHGEAVIELDPGMSFGTGHHPTTAYSLKIIDRLAGATKSFLDIGCGSGILSIAASKLNYAPIKAFDIDPDSITVASDNFKKNHIPHGTIDLQVKPLDEIKPNSNTYDLVAANILAHVLLANREQIFSFVKPDGNLILAGILSEEFEGVKQEFCGLGLKEVERFSEKEWTSALFHKITENHT